MNADIEIILSFDGYEWLANIDNHRISAVELRELEERIIHTIRQMPRFANRETVHVWAGFDYNSIPSWLRQYHAHYFNTHYKVSLSSVRDPFTINK